MRVSRLFAAGRGGSESIEQALFTGKKQGTGKNCGPGTAVSAGNFPLVTVACSQDVNVTSRELRRLTKGTAAADIR
jgi:hypothetical protein